MGYCVLFESITSVFYTLQVVQDMIRAMRDNSFTTSSFHDDLKTVCKPITISLLLIKPKRKLEQGQSTLFQSWESESDRPSKKLFKPSNIFSWKTRILAEQSDWETGKIVRIFSDSQSDCKVLVFALTCTCFLLNHKCQENDILSLLHH